MKKKLMKDLKKLKNKLTLNNLSVSFIGFFLAALIFEWLWNSSLVPAIQLLNNIGYFQACGILLIARCIFRK